jgi:hypothetical protein
MVDQDILLAKIASIRKCLDRIQKVTGGSPESLDNEAASLLGFPSLVFPAGLFP